MKILQINATNGTGGIGRTTLEMAEFLNNNNHDCYIAYAEGIPYFKEFKIGNEIDRKIHSLLSRIFGLQAYFSKNSTKKLIKFIKKEKFNVVHLRNLHHNYINLKILLEYLAKEDIPTVLTLHDCWAYTGKCTYYTSDNCYRWQEKCGNCVRIKKDNPSWFFDQTQKMLKDKKELFINIPRLAVIGVSDWITNEAKKSVLQNAKIIKRIYNWIPEDFKPINTDELRNNLDVKEKYIILGVASKWSLENKSSTKGLDIFLELSKILPDDMIIILVGALDKNVELPNNIIHINQTNNIYDLINYYSLADLLLNPSKEETFGKVTAEAILCGTPALVANFTAGPEIVNYNKKFILKSFSSKLILKKINEIRSTYNKDVNEFDKKKFVMVENILEYLDVYDKLINISNL